MTFSAGTRSGLRQAKHRIKEQYSRNDPNVVGVGLSYRHRAGQLTDEPVVVVLVAKKRPASHVSRRRLLPQSIDVQGARWGVDVVESGPPPRLFATAPARPPVRLLSAQAIADKMRPSRQGASISNLEQGRTAGTHGCNVVDKTDGKLCLLSCNHVLARLNEGKPGEAIIQPGGYDGEVDVKNAIAELKRFDPVDATTGTDTDAAIAQFTDQSGQTSDVAKDLMAPISPSHPAVGLLVAGGCSGAVYLTEIETVLARLDVKLAAATGSSTAIVAPAIGMKVEKVGRTTAYSSSAIAAIEVDIEVDTQSALGVVPYRDLIYVPGLGQAGDSGSVVCAGGDGDTLVESDCGGCTVLNSIGSFYDLPLAGDNDLADQIRDGFLAQSVAGSLLVAITYMNSQNITDRLAGMVADSTSKSYAASYYARYRDFIENVLNDPTSTAVVTQENLDDATNINAGLVQTFVITGEECVAANQLQTEILDKTLGMNRQQMLTYMNDGRIAARIREILSTVPTIELDGPVEAG
ncbi:hypothetical protein [Streptomyces sp. LN549]|uniref:hypothetical protein n=1 Tax=Streptomyces sp. LN549 TaxID=3112979 RepID=UPI00371B2D4C